MNINDFDDFQNNDIMGDGQMDPKELRRKTYLFFFGGFITLNILYYFLSFFLNFGPFKLIAGFFNYPTAFPPINILLVLIILFIFIFFKQFKSNTRKKDKENIIGFISLINVGLFILLSTIAYKQYIGSVQMELGFFGIILLIISFVGIAISTKQFYLHMVDFVKDLLNKEPEEEPEEEEETPYNKYDWIKIFYNVNNNEYIEDDASKFGIPQPHVVLPFIIGEMNSTLLIEKKKLCTKEIYEAGNSDEFLVQIDFPSEFNSEDDVYDAIEAETYGFSNKYILINNSFLAIKIKTTHLNNPKYLEELGENILPAQKKDALEQVPFTAKKKPSPEEMLLMTENGKRKPYRLFDGLTISKIKNDYYIVFKYSPWYKKLVIFPQLDTLPEMLDEVSEGFGSKPFNPKIYLGYQSAGGYIGLNLQKMRHLLFGGQSGSGKSVFLNSIIYQILFFTKPSEVQLMLIDPLKVSFRPFKKIKNLIFPVAGELNETIDSINFLMEEQGRRYTFLEALGYEDIYEYNNDIDKSQIKMLDHYGLSATFSLKQATSKHEQVNKQDLANLQDKVDSLLGINNSYKIGEKMSQIVLIYDEFAKFIEDEKYKREKTMTTLVKISEQGRKAGIILILGTQTINADTVPSVLRNNIPTRVCLKVMGRYASKAIIGEEAENTGLGSSLSGNGDMLVYNGEILGISLAVRGQGFYVSKEDLDELLRLGFDEYGVNSFVYKENEEDEYLWIKEFYNVNKKEVGILKEEEISRNIIFTKEKRIKFTESLPFLINTFNKFFKFYRSELLDKGSLVDEYKNIKIDTIKYQSKEELRKTINTLPLSNKYITITNSYIDFKINTEELSSEDKLYKMEEKLELKLTKLKESIKFFPYDNIGEEDRKYIKMLKDGYKAFQLIESYEIVKENNLLYLRVNFTKYYKEFVVFPQTITILEQLEKKIGPKITEMLEGKQYIIGSGVIE